MLSTKNQKKKIQKHIKMNLLVMTNLQQIMYAVSYSAVIKVILVKPEKERRVYSIYKYIDIYVYKFINIFI